MGNTTKKKLAKSNKKEKQGKEEIQRSAVGSSPVTEDASHEARILTLEKKLKVAKKRITDQLQQLSDRNAALLRKTSESMQGISTRHENLVRKTEKQMKSMSDKNSALLKKTDDQLSQLSERNAALLRKTGDQLEQLSQRNEALLRKMSIASK